MSPQRIQLRRTRGWRMPPNTVKVDRSTRWGNPYEARLHGQARSVELFVEMLAGDRRLLRDGHADRYPSDEQIRAALAGRNLGCWCGPAEPCHADVLFRVANRITEPRPNSRKDLDNA